jgi:hypothetical protein
VRARELRNGRGRRSLVEIDTRIGKRRNGGSDDVRIGAEVGVGIETGIEIRTELETRIGMKTGRGERRRSVESVSAKRTKGASLAVDVGWY